MADNAVSYHPARARSTLFAALVEARRTFGPERPILIDGDERKLTYPGFDPGGPGARSRAEEEHAPRRSGGRGCLPGTGIGSVISVFALSAYGRVPAMLNFTAGAHSLHAALRSAQVRSIITAHRFIELGKFEALEAEPQIGRQVDLPGGRQGWGSPPSTRGAAAIGSFLPRIIVAQPSPDKPAVILFTSGTEGEPKGVVLSHANILANVEQVRAHIAFYESDVVFNPLPTFHSFGLTVGAFMPLFLGVQAVFHPSPRQPHEIVRRIRENRATMLLATDTFISQYLRTAADVRPGKLAPRGLRGPNACTTRRVNSSNENMRLSFLKATVRHGKPRRSYPPISRARTGLAPWAMSCRRVICASSPSKAFARAAG